MVELGVLRPLLCYPGKINQVVMNLLANAVDACDSGGQVTLRTCETVTTEPQAGAGAGSEPGGVEIHVIDNGQGIDPGNGGQDINLNNGQDFDLGNGQDLNLGTSTWAGPTWVASTWATRATSSTPSS